MRNPTRPQSSAAVTLSVLDRLTDADPKSKSRNAQLTRAESVRAFKAGVRRDLEWLLNTRCKPEGAEALSLAEKSILDYGLPDFSSYSLASPKDQAKLIRILQAAIATFEPRLANVRIVQLDVASTGTRSIRVRLEGMLMMDPAPEWISFDTTLQLTTGDFQIREEG